MRASWAALMIVCYGTAPAWAEDGAWRPTLQQVTALEAKVRLPKGADRLSAYARHYSGRVIAGHRLIEGYFTSGSGERPGIFVDEQRDFIDDGGCSVVTVFYHPIRNTFAGIFCNGEA